jgi:UDP-N-acetylmuramyl tripeptide synthase
MTAPRTSRFDPRLSVAVCAAKGASFAIRRLGRGGGTAAPGLIADRLDPAMLAKLAARLPEGNIVVAGTNGKTTTSRMIADLLEAHGWRVVHNRSGSNLVRGVAAAFAERSSPAGVPGGDFGVIEADEAAFPDIVARVQPRAVVLTNLFRDQLDRYGELDTIVRKWRPALAGLPATSVVVVDVDDPALAMLSDGLAARRVAFGMRGLTQRLDALPHAADSGRCPRCAADLAYDALYVSHLGEWRCPGCGMARPALDVAGEAVQLRGVESLALTIATGGERWPLEVGVPGLYNAYNALAAAALGHALDVPPATTQRTLGAFRSAFGRIERVTLRGRTLTIALVKNPVGFNEVLRMLAPDGRLDTPTLIAINDLAADGRDVSWLWDVDFEILGGAEGAAVATTGLRGADMANRLKYAGLPAGRLRPLADELPAALDAFVASLPEGGQGYILPTYTAMLELRQILAGLGAVDNFWKQ